MEWKLQWAAEMEGEPPLWGPVPTAKRSAHRVGVGASGSVRNTRGERVQWGRDVVWPEWPLHVAPHLCVLEQQQRGQCQLLTFS